MRKIIGAICVLVICGLLAAGLWPYNPFPKNDVSWLRDGAGLRFGPHGIIFSIHGFELPRSDQESFCSLEILLEPALGYVKNSVTILVFHNPDNPLQFGMMQDRDELVVTGDYRDQQNHLRTAELRIALLVGQGEQALFTITSGPKGTAAYRNGAFVDSSSGLGLSCKNFSGQLVIGNSPIAYDAWQGKLLGIAIYNQELSPELILRHYETWTQNPRLWGFQNNCLLALYSFGERSGRIIHNSIGSEPDLYIPETFEILDKKILAPPWKEFSPDLSYVWGALINVAGFIPFGFFFCAYLTWDRQWNRAAVVTILLGGMISIAIEILQGFIPSRMSGVTDIITNTLGTGLGVMFWRWESVQILTTRLRGPSAN
jgi:VanZ family protein